MSILLRHFKQKQILRAYEVLTAVKARQAHFLPEFTPGPYPRTKEEREAAAKKYNLLPEEYEPFPENDCPVGDYPKLPIESVDARDPYYPWDFPELKKDYNEAVFREIIMYLPDGLSTAPRETTLGQDLLLFFLTTASVGLMIYILYQFKIVIPVAEKQYVTPGVTHYTFDPLSSEELEKLRAEKRLRECLEACKSPQK